MSCPMPFMPVMPFRTLSEKLRHPILGGRGWVGRLGRNFDILGSYLKETRGYLMPTQPWNS